MSPVIVALLMLVAVSMVVCSGEGKALTLTLERASHEGLELSQLKDRDRVRHGRYLQQQPHGVIGFPVDGTYNPFLVGLYYTRVSLGNPSRDFYVQIDTGSDVLWVSCSQCTGCPRSTGLNIPLQYFDRSSSSTASLVSCTDQRCSQASDTGNSVCTPQNQCGYTFHYGDGSATSGYYVSDSFHFDSINGNSSISNNSARVVFGCSTQQSGDLTKSDRSVDGIFGFGQDGLSVISQLYSQGVAPNSFSHCLKGDNRGGGILVLGQIDVPNIVYTPLVPSQPHYNVNLESISVNGQRLAISPSVFETSQTQGTGTIIDSGTTLAYLAEGAFDPFVTAITDYVSQYVQPIVVSGDQCYLTASSISDVFPQVSLNFAGSSSMILRPRDYLLQQNPNNAEEWCIGFQRNTGLSMTILGDIVLKDKVVIYDLGGQRIGWADFDCSTTIVNVSTSRNGETQFVNVRDNSSSGAINEPYYKLMIPCVLLALWFRIAFLGYL